MSLWALFGFVHAQIPAGEIVIVEALDRCLCCGCINKLDKGESSWASGRTIDWQKDIAEFAHFSKKAFQFLLCGIKTQVPYKKFGANAVLLINLRIRLFSKPGYLSTNLRIRESVSGIFSDGLRDMSDALFVKNVEQTVGNPPG